MALFRARGLARGCSLLVIAAVASCCAHPGATGPSIPPPPNVNLAPDLARAVTVDAMMGHLKQLQQAADANGGNRAEGTPGYDASADYVIKALKDRGFEVQAPELSRLKVLTEGKPLVAVGGRPYAVDQASYFAQTPKDGLKASIIRPSGKASGCAAADYGSLNVTGQIAVVDGTGCSVVEKHNVAKEKGAAAVLVAMQAGGGEGLFTPNYYEQLSIPVGIIDSGVDTTLRRNSAPVTLVLDMNVMKVRSRTIIAQTTTGDSANVVLAGAHLDSVSKGPGINDNGTGVAAVLETALQLGPNPAVNNAVRFAFWAAEEDGLAGSLEYTKGRNTEELNDIALYLNFDMLGSPNAGYFVLDGDQSASKPDPNRPPLDIPEGSAGIERTFAGYLNLAGKRPAALEFNGRSDYGPFLSAGIPVGGISSGALEKMSGPEAKNWQGRAGQPFDPNYHGPKDTLANVGKDSLAINGSAVAFAVGTYALSTIGPNGVPERKVRRHSPGAK
ncbi:M28 family peptidase [Mycobacterium sp. CBMA271]|uniref:M28 family metallopeptidase n=1 Tax=unclassified Mycobacteroides TaxID=2618759 RepID=UPI001329B36E|nr:MULTISPECIES: M28 family metallopeptidase [unclassified Mycobacteroides]MUM15376.1 peptidase M28 [Mycobacteroides sp. CBMA 326]MUM21277.1 M28 family peptidase [Mycobacteroides sp. CBMA 271]